MPEHDVVDVGAHGLADRGDGVDEADLGGEEGVGGVLDGLCRRGVGDDERRGHRHVQRLDPDGRRLVVGPDDDPVGVQEVVDGRALAEELGVRHHVDVAAPQRPFDHPGRADRHGRLVDHDRIGFEVGSDLVGGGLDVAEVGRTVVALWGRNAQVDELAPRRSVGVRGREPQQPGIDRIGHDLLEAVLENRHPARLELTDPGGVDVGAHHLVPELGETCARREADVAGADDGDLAHEEVASSEAVR